MTENLDDERSALLYFLGYQRASVHAIVAGLDEVNWHRATVPSGWTIAGIVEHLGYAERHWFHDIVTGTPGEQLAWDSGRPDYDPSRALTCDRPSVEVLAYYRAQCEKSDEILARTAMSAVPRGSHGPEMETPSVRWVVLHMIEETAAHSGHLEIARELLDGSRDLGLR